MKKQKINGVIKKAIEKFGDKFDYSLVVNDYVNMKSVVKIICKKHGEFLQSMSNHLNSNHGCKQCGYESNSKRFKLSKDEFLKRAILKFGDEYDYSRITDANILNDKVEIICRKHGLFLKSTHHHLNRGQGCPKCSFDNIAHINENRHENIKKNFVLKCQEAHGDEFEYLSEYESHDVKVLIRCTRCGGEFYQKPHNHLSGQGCPRCKMSKGERKIERWLIEHNIDFESQKWFSDCRGKRRPLPFDFWIANDNVLIEYQGRQHYDMVDFSHNKNVNEMKINLKNVSDSDRIKREYCSRKGIKLIEIPYWDFNNIDKYLHKQFFKEM